jgi:chemotaxis protein histidine kinase CheA
MTTPAAPGKAVLIAPDEYPALLTGHGTAAFLNKLASPETAKHAARMIAMRRDALCDAVLDYIRQLESAAQTADIPDVYDQAHEIRGLAETAGMAAAGRIADGLCRYLDASKEQKSTVDPAVVALHVDAIVRASSSAEDAGKFGSRVAVELGALVARKLGTANAQK